MRSRIVSFIRIGGIVVFLVVFINYISIYAQIVVVDSANRPIPFVQISSSSNYFYAQTGLNGEAPFDAFKKLNSIDTIFFNHVSYKRAAILKKDLSDRDKIEMQRNTRELKELFVQADRSAKKFHEVRACYRSIQWTDDTTVYYTDGKADYYSKIGKDKHNIFRSEYRTLKNERYLESLAKRKVGITFIAASTPRPPVDYLPAPFIKEHKLEVLKSDSTTVYLQDRNGQKVGQIHLNEQHVVYALNDIYSVRTRKALKTEVRVERKELTMIFQRIKGVDWQYSTDLENLRYMKVTKEYLVKHDKDTEYAHVVGLDELFIESVGYTDSWGSEKFRYRYAMPKTSEYGREFWKNCDCEFYTISNNQFLNGLVEQ